jgi:hypothetical protein
MTGAVYGAGVGRDARRWLGAMRRASRLWGTLGACASAAPGLRQRECGYLCRFQSTPAFFPASSLRLLLFRLHWGRALPAHVRQARIALGVAPVQWAGVFFVDGRVCGPAPLRRSPREARGKPWRSPWGVACAMLALRCRRAMHAAPSGCPPARRRCSGVRSS